MDVFEPIRRGYHAIGLGADQDVLAMLDQDGPRPARWEIHRFAPRRRRLAGEIAALTLFGPVPQPYELVRVQVTSWEPDARTGHLVVNGSFRLRRRGTWDTEELPFSHVWSFAGGRVQSVTNVLQGFELRRLPESAPRAA